MCAQCWSWWLSRASPLPPRVQARGGWRWLAPVTSCPRSPCPGTRPRSSAGARAVTWPRSSQSTRRTASIRCWPAATSTGSGWQTRPRRGGLCGPRVTRSCSTTIGGQVTPMTSARGSRTVSSNLWRLMTGEAGLITNVRTSQLWGTLCGIFMLYVKRNFLSNNTECKFAFNTFVFRWHFLFMAKCNCFFFVKCVTLCIYWLSFFRQWDIISINLDDPNCLSGMAKTKWPRNSLSNMRSACNFSISQGCYWCHCEAALMLELSSVWEEHFWRHW